MSEASSSSNPEKLLGKFLSSVLLSVEKGANTQVIVTLGLHVGGGCLLVLFSYLLLLVRSLFLFSGGWWTVVGGGGGGGHNYLTPKWLNGLKLNDSQASSFKNTYQCPPPLSSSSAPAACALLLCLGTGLLGFGSRSLLQLRWQQQQQ